MPIVRRWTITDREGREIPITSREVLQDLISQMTPEEYEKWKAQYRFAPIFADMDNFPDYDGLIRDLL